MLFACYWYQHVKITMDEKYAYLDFFNEKYNENVRNSSILTIEWVKRYFYKPEEKWENIFNNLTQVFSKTGNSLRKKIPV